MGFDGPTGLGGSFGPSSAGFGLTATKVEGSGGTSGAIASMLSIFSPPLMVQRARNNSGVILSSARKRTLPSAMMAKVPFLPLYSAQMYGLKQSNSSDTPRTVAPPPAIQGALKSVGTWISKIVLSRPSLISAGVVTRS